MLWLCVAIVVTDYLSSLQLISKASKDTTKAGLRVLDLACGKGGDLGKWAAHPDGVEKYVGSDIAFGSLEHLVERMSSEFPLSLECSPKPNCSCCICMVCTLGAAPGA